MSKIIGRSSWGYRAVKPMPSAPTNRRGLVLHHTVTPEWTGNAGMRRLNELMIRMGFATVGYTLAVDVNGNIFSGRPLNVVGGHTRGHNSTRHALTLIGNFSNKRPPPAMEEAIVWTYRHGIERGWWGASLVGHRDLGQTACPGGSAYSRLSHYRSARLTTPAPKPQEWSDMATEAEIRQLIDNRIERAFDLGNARDGRHITETHRELTRLLEAADLGRLRDLQYVVDGFRRLRDAGLLDAAEEIVDLTKGSDEDRQDLG